MSTATPSRGPGEPPPAEGERGAPGPGAEAWALLWELFTGQKHRGAALAAEFDLSPMQLHALRVLEPGDPRPMSAVAGHLMCDASNVTGIVDRLEARGLIERRPSEHDRRVKMLEVTEAGARLRAELVRRMMEPPPPIAGLSAADQRTLRDVLRRALGR